MSADPLIGQQLDEYQLDKLLGQGGMARVYRGLDIGLKRYAAIKVIDTPFQHEEDYLRRFEVEAQAIAQLDHPNIVSLYRYGQAQDVLYMAMKYVEGADLQVLLTGYEASSDLMPWEEVLRIMREIASALDYAHSKGVVHRDIKPSNIMLDEQGRAYLTDFGLALLTTQGTQGQIFGTPQYIAPEQAISSAGAVPQSDFYAIGVILYRMMTGVLPFAHDDLLEIAMLHMTEPPTPPSQHRPEINAAIEAVILKSLAKEPQDRFADGATFFAALEKAGQKDATTLIAAPALSIMDRVALDMERLPPPPPVTDGVVLPPAQEVPSHLAQSETSETFIAGLPFSPKVLSMGVVILLLFLFAGGYLLFGDGDEENPESETAVLLGAEVEAEMTVVATSVATPSPDDENTGMATNTAVASVANETEDTTLPSTSPMTDTTGFLFMPVIVSDNEGTGSEPVTEAAEPTSAPTDVPEPTVTSTPEPTPEPEVGLSIYRLTIDRDKETLFITNLGDISIDLTSLAFAFKNEEPTALWPVATLPPATCVLMVKEDKSASDKLEKTACEQIVGTFEQEWKDDFSVFYQGTEIKSCKVKGNNGNCELEWIVP